MDDLILRVLLGVPFPVWALIAGVSCFTAIGIVAWSMRRGGPLEDWPDV